MWLIEWWAGLDWRIRIAIPLAFLALSTVLLVCGILWPWGWGVGAVLFLFGGRSDAEKKGY